MSALENHGKESYIETSDQEERDDLTVNFRRVPAPLESIRHHTPRKRRKVSITSFSSRKRDKCLDFS